MRLIDADALMESVKKWLPEDPCGKEEKEFPFETDICVSMLMEIAEAQTIEPEPSQVTKDIARIVENGQDMRVIEAAQPTPDKNGDLWITVPDIDKVTCIYVQESKSEFCRIFYEEQPERIIHCKDCEWWTKQECSPQGRCALSGMYPTGGWFCGNARRREVTA